MQYRKIKNLKWYRIKDKLPEVEKSIIFFPEAPLVGKRTKDDVWYPTRLCTCDLNDEAQWSYDVEEYFNEISKNKK